MTIFKEILKASRNNQANIFAFTFKIKLKKIKTNTTQSHCKSFEGRSTWFSVYVIRPTITLHPY